jgi:hypothetical protein
LTLINTHTTANMCSETPGDNGAKAPTLNLSELIHEDMYDADHNSADEANLAVLSMAHKLVAKSMPAVIGMPFTVISALPMAPMLMTSSMPNGSGILMTIKLAHPYLSLSGSTLCLLL